LVGQCSQVYPSARRFCVEFKYERLSAISISDPAPGLAPAGDRCVAGVGPPLFASVPGSGL